MKIINDILLCDEEFKNTYVAIGAFDGIHIGHRALITKAVENAKKNGGKSVVFTFLTHPLQTIDVKKAPKLINSIEEKKYIIESLGVDYLIMQPFTQEFSMKTPEEFIYELLRDKLDSKEIFVGFNFSFGKGGHGTVDLLKTVGKEEGIGVTIEEPVMVDEKIVSSTYIRKKLTHGELEKANRCLGEPFLVIGEVVHGRKLGRVMGFPTANLKILDKIYPPFGIYGGKVKIQGEEKYWDAVINIGRNPTLKPDEKSIEVHILDFNDDIYGKKICVSLMEHLRDEKKFSSMEELKNTINNDVRVWREKIKGN